MTTATSPGDADAVDRGQMDEPGFFGARDDARRGCRSAAVIAWRNSPPFSASRVALVATAMISSTRCDSARRRNFDSTCSAACIASGVSARPSRPPAPSRTISFSRSMTSNERSGRTCTTIMWSELVPMSMAAMRMTASRLNCTSCHHYNQVVPRPSISCPFHRPVTNCSETRSTGSPDVTRRRGGRRPGAARARVASRRLRELLPVLQLDGDARRKLGRRLRKVTARLGHRPRARRAAAAD